MRNLTHPWLEEMRVGDNRVAEVKRPGWNEVEAFLIKMAVWSSRVVRRMPERVKIHLTSRAAIRKRELNVKKEHTDLKTALG